jgi:hypothetical protein
VLDYKRELLRCLSIGTGLPVDKLDEVSGSHCGPAPSSAQRVGRSSARQTGALFGSLEHSFEPNVLGVCSCVPRCLGTTARSRQMFGWEESPEAETAVWSPASPLPLPWPWRPQDMQRPLYMRPRDALEYGVIDEIIEPDADKQASARGVPGNGSRGVEMTLCAAC